MYREGKKALDTSHWSLTVTDCSQICTNTGGKRVEQNTSEMSEVAVAGTWLGLRDVCDSLPRRRPAAHCFPHYDTTSHFSGALSLRVRRGRAVHVSKSQLATCNLPANPCDPYDLRQNTTNHKVEGTKHKQALYLD